MATSAVTFYEVDGTAWGSERVLCPWCLGALGGSQAPRGRGRVWVVASLPPDEDEPRVCWDCERPQHGYWSQFERWVGEAVEGEHRALAEPVPF
jgi:hypothetical protein